VSNATLNAPHPFLFNLSMEMIERFRQQLSLINIQFEADSDLVRKAVWSCYQESPVEFRDHSLYDPGAYPEPPLSGKITWRITQPWTEVLDEKEREWKRKAQELMERLRASSLPNFSAFSYTTGYSATFALSNMPKTGSSP